MANYYLDFVGLNTYIYEPAGDEAAQTNEVLTNGDTVYTNAGYIGIYNSSGDSNIERVLEKYKNNAFSTATSLSLATPTLFTALMIRRNGPYGWPAFKGIRMGQNPLTRNQKKNNVLSILSDPVPVTRVIDGKQSTIMPKRGTIALYDEPSVVARHHPLMHAFGFVLDDEPSYGRRSSRIRRLRIKHSFDNRIYNFTNKEINKTLRIPDSDLANLSDESLEAPDSLEDYIGLSGMYLDGALDDPDNPIDEFLRMRYKSTIYPPERFTFKKITRQRTTFNFSWRDSLANRQQESSTDGFTTMGSVYGAGSGAGKMKFNNSIWPLDVDPNWVTDQLYENSMVHTMGIAHSGSNYSLGGGVTGSSYQTTSSYGILWNHYAQGSRDLHVVGGVRTSARAAPNHTARDTTINERLRPAPYYARRHMWGHKESVTSPTGLLGIRAGEDMNSNKAKHLFSGEAYWDAPSQSNSSPFYDSYDEYVKDIKLVGKNYSIIPEFRISNFVESYQTKSVNSPIVEFLSINGGPSGYSDSSTKKFYDVYATSELMNSFDFLLEDHEDFAKPTRLTITCNAISKFLPYDGFYPVQRSVKLAEQFYDSYSDYFSFGSASVDGGSSFFGGGAITTYLSASAQAILEPLFAPGVLFNSIKSGVACDWPTVQTTASSDVVGILNSYTLQMRETSFDRRVPFEALVEPQKYLANIPLRTTEQVNSSSWASTSSWDGNGDNLYAKMAHNFFGEIPNFFLNGSTYSTIASKKNKDIFFVRERTTYAMRVDMYRTMANRRQMVTNSVGNLYYPPQDFGNGNLKENITMYSRPSAFGVEPDGRFKWEYAGDSNVITSVPEADGYGVSVSDDGTYGVLEIKSEEGLNYPYTPPYYHGHAWADIVYKSGTRQGRVPLDEIIASSSISYWRFDDSVYRTSRTPFSNDTVYPNAISRGPQAINVLNDNAMQISASVNLLGFAQVGEFNENVVENQENSRWVIQTKFETPILNFKKYEQSSSITVPNNPTSASVPRGMWHQFGELPTKNEGIYLKISDVPKSWNIAHNRPIKEHPTASLADLVGFSTQPLRLGQMPESTSVREAIVLIPYKESNEGKQFFKIEETPEFSRVTVETALKMASDPEFGINNGQGTVQRTLGLEMPDRTIVDMVTKMQQFVIPPQMDFVNYPEAIDPFLMYIIDFEYTFSREDLQYIWQGLKPPSAENHSLLKRSLSHKLLKNGLLTQDDLINSKNLKWIVFKVKQRANTNYFDKIYLQAGQSNFGRQQPQGKLAAIPESTLIEKIPNKGITYNWPYDFFSFIELVKVDASVDFKGTDEEGKEMVLKRNEAAVKRADQFIRPSTRPFSGD